ncbi:hypothetical protein F5Y06DRAFT_300598 [Hypoxylon sp. FL0890]|nr:hypothetical protein F5Y06DRAFT_300598 [Hypoxylon sp. FL0890]
MGSLDDDPSIEAEIRVYWDLLMSIISPFIASLPCSDQNAQPASCKNVPIIPPLIRSTLECIGNDLDPERYSLDLPNLHEDVQKEVHRVLCEALEKLEEFVLNSIMSENGPRRNYVTKFHCLETLRALERSTDTVNLDKRPIDYITITKSNTEKLFVLYNRLQPLLPTVKLAFPKILPETYPTRREVSVKAAQRAQEFGKLAEALFSAIAKQLDEDWKEGHCENGYCKHKPCKNKQVGFIRVAMLGKSDVDLFLPLCSKSENVHPTSCFLPVPPRRTSSLGIGRSENKITRIGTSIRKSRESRRKLFLKFEGNHLWENKEGNRELWAPWKGTPLSSFIQGYDEREDNVNTKAFTSQNRAEIPVLLAHSMLYLYRTHWFQHYWEIDKVLWMNKENSSTPRKQYPYLECVLSMDDSKRAMESIVANGENCDPLYRHLLIWEFGLRLLEIRTGSRFPPNLEKDKNPEDDSDEPHPFFTLQRVLDYLKDKGEVEDAYYQIAESCLDFDVKLDKFESVEPDLREWVAIHNLIFSPLLQLLAQRFKTAAADFLDLEQDIWEMHNTIPDACVSRGKSPPSKDNEPDQHRQNELSPIFKEHHVSLHARGNTLALLPRHSSSPMHHN